MRLDSGAADLALKMHRLNDLYSATPVHPGELLSFAAFKHLDLLRERARPIFEADRKLLRDFLNNNQPFCRLDGVGHHIIPPIA